MQKTSEVFQARSHIDPQVNDNHLWVDVAHTHRAANLSSDFCYAPCCGVSGIGRTQKSHSVKLDFPPSTQAISIHVRGLKINIITILAYFSVLTQVKIHGALGHLLWEGFCTKISIAFYSKSSRTDELVSTGSQYYGWNEQVDCKVIFQRGYMTGYKIFPLPWIFFSLFKENNQLYCMCVYRGLPNEVGLEAALF